MIRFQPLMADERSTLMQIVRAELEPPPVDDAVSVAVDADTPARARRHARERDRRRE